VEPPLGLPPVGPGLVPARVRLRPVRASEVELLEGWRADEEAQGPFGWFGFEPPGALGRRHERDGLLGEDRGNLLVVGDLPDHTPIGEVSYIAVHHGPPPASRAFNLGIYLVPEHRGRGHGAEAQRQLAAYLFATTLVERVEASTDVDNLAERRALEKAGFTREGVLRHAQFRAGAFRDLVLYSKLRGE
jgi:RimJ/RimL family protein N-acetyltransferase